MNALADLNNPGNIATGALSAFKAGAEFGNEIRTRGALATYARDPSQANALALLPYKPDVALKLDEAQRDRQFNEAAGAFAGPQRNALLGTGALGGQPQRVAPAIPGSPAGAVSEQPPANPDFRVLGEPQDERDEAFLRMVQIDAKRAFAMQGTMRDAAAKRLDLQHKAYGLAVSRLGSVTDEDSYQAALAEIQAEIAPLGVDVRSHLPSQFPGKAGLRELRLNALDAKDQLAHLMQQDNIDADNDRADRNTASVITDRDARRAETRRAHDQRDGTTRRGQDVRGSRPPSSRAPAREALPTVSTPEEAAKLPKGTKFRTPDGKVRVRP